MEEPIDMAADAFGDAGSFNSASVGLSDDELAGSVVATPSVARQSGRLGESSFEKNEAGTNAA